MIKQLATAALLFAAIGAQAQQPLITIPKDKTQSSPRLNSTQVRADRLSDQMVLDLHLNGYQSSRLRAINAAQVKKMQTIAQKNADNPKAIDQQCDAVCRERDKDLRAVLSNDQYTNYYGLRSAYNQMAKNYALQATDAQFVKSVQEPLPASSRGATVGPARTTNAKPASTTARGR